jgi:hypothetical protein
VPSRIARADRASTPRSRSITRTASAPVARVATADSSRPPDGHASPGRGAGYGLRPARDGNSQPRASIRSPIATAILSDATANRTRPRIFLRSPSPESSTTSSASKRTPLPRPSPRPSQSDPGGGGLGELTTRPITRAGSPSSGITRSHREAAGPSAGIKDAPVATHARSPLVTMLHRPAVITTPVPSSTSATAAAPRTATVDRRHESAAPPPAATAAPANAKVGRSPSSVHAPQIGGRPHPIAKASATHGTTGGSRLEVDVKRRVIPQLLVMPRHVVPPDASFPQPDASVPRLARHTESRRLFSCPTPSPRSPVPVPHRDPVHSNR